MPRRGRTPGQLLRARNWGVAVGTTCGRSPGSRATGASRVNLTRPRRVTFVPLPPSIARARLSVLTSRPSGLARRRCVLEKNASCHSSGERATGLPCAPASVPLQGMVYLPVRFEDYVSVVGADEWAAFAEGVGYPNGTGRGHGGDGLVPGKPGDAVPPRSTGVLLPRSPRRRKLARRLPAACSCRRQLGEGAGLSGRFPHTPRGRRRLGGSRRARAPRRAAPSGRHPNV